MEKLNSTWRLASPSLAIGRLHLLASKDGPLNPIAALCSKFNASLLNRLMDCFYCVCFWFSLPLSIWLTSGWIGVLLHWQAISPWRPASWRRSFAGKNRHYPELTLAE